MGWGAMMGLGQSLQQVGGMLMDMNKEKMRNQLEMERDKRKEALDLAKEQRQMEQFGGAYEFDRDNGLKYRINKAGNRMADPTPISAEEIAAYEREQETARLDAQIKANTAAKGGLELVLKQDEVTHLATDRDQARRIEEARLAEIKARTASHLTRASGGGSGSDSTSTVSNEQLANQLLTEYKDLTAEYAKSTDNPNGLTREELLHMAAASVKQAQHSRQNAREIFRIALGDYAQRRAKSRGK